MHAGILTDPFDTWLGTRPKWLQTAASDMLENRAPANEMVV